jgi:hypothetical protein
MYIRDVQECRRICTITMSSGSNRRIEKFSVVIGQESRHGCVNRVKKDKNIDNHSVAEGERTITRWPTSERGDNLITQLQN